MYSYALMASWMPSSIWAMHRESHLLANSVSSGSSGIKLEANAMVRPVVLVPTT